MTDFAARYGPWAVVAGASEGLGAAFARALAARGLNLVLFARRRDALDALAASLGVEVRAVALDLAQPDLAAAVADVVGDIDVGLLVYNAAYAPIGAFAELPLADKLRAVDTNCRGPVTLADALAPRLRRRGRGGIVLMSSLAGALGSPLVATYAATKAFNLVLAEGLWDELGQLGIDVIACRAGATRTPNYEASQPVGKV
ncbi:MAG TPA: SDR family NAD(P)-dependent oxidoreductase, partial [Haliangiales bacterium]|nr:SDR family NAD(P)-dependent oxidoreductase [Haliangiales bacterium]